MEQYIPKSALVAMIRKRLLPVIRDKHYDEWEEGKDSERIAILDIINTFEVKEVDLDKEVDAVMKRFLGNITCKEEQLKFAKHFFELGMSVSNKAQK